MDGNEKPYDIRKVFQLIDGFQNSYESLWEIKKGHFQLRQSLPICIWDKKLNQKLSENNQIITSCQLLGLEMCHQAAFDMRHKILLALQELPEAWCKSGKKEHFQ